MVLACQSELHVAPNLPLPYIHQQCPPLLCSDAGVFRAKQSPSPSFKMCTLLSNRDLLTSGELSQREGGGVWNRHTVQAMVCAMMVMGNQLEPEDIINLPILPLSQESENMYTCCS